jgi:hypothetical protein
VPACNPTYSERGIDWDDANNELFDYIVLLSIGNLDPEEDEWITCVKQSLTRTVDSLGKAIVEALESHDGKWPGDKGRCNGPGPRFLLHNLRYQCYGILDLRRRFQVKFPIYELLDMGCKIHLVVCSVLCETSRASETTRGCVIRGLDSPSG